MNQKQSIIGWAMILLIGIAIAQTIMALPETGLASIIKFYFSLVVVLIIGGLLIYILRGKQSKA